MLIHISSDTKLCLNMHCFTLIYIMIKYTHFNHHLKDLVLLNFKNVYTSIERIDE